MRASLAILVILVSTLTCQGQDSNTVFFRDVNTRCINSSKDAIWLTVVDYKTTIHQGFLAQDSSTGVMIDAAVDNGDKNAHFPVLLDQQIPHGATATDAIQVPVGKALMTNYKLTNSDLQVDALNISVKLVRKQSPTAWGSAFLALADISKQIKLPSNPYTDGFQLFANFANSAVQKSLETPDAPSTLPIGTLELGFSSDDENIANNCTDFSRTGIVAIIDNVPGRNENEGYPDITRQGDYCWYADLSSGVQLSYAKKDNNGACGTGAAWHSLESPRLAFLLQKRDASGQPASPSLPAPPAPPVTGGHRFLLLNPRPNLGRLATQGQLDEAESMIRCQAIGIRPVDCLPGVKHTVPSGKRK
ncbi:MAG TPA: hypothetical protein VK699_20875 [Terriglobales bacterium]|jgi:hypothetical protein|nr:hypothetical protein [Terriglobales bacterium]